MRIFWWRKQQQPQFNVKRNLHETISTAHHIFKFSPIWIDYSRFIIKYLINICNSTGVSKYYLVSRPSTHKPNKFFFTFPIAYFIFLLWTDPYAFNIDLRGCILALLILSPVCKEPLGTRKHPTVPRGWSKLSHPSVISKRTGGSEILTIDRDGRCPFWGF